MLRRVLVALAPSRSSPGIDWLSCAAWAAHEVGAKVLWLPCVWMMDGQRLFAQRGDSLQAFLPAGCQADDDDDRGVNRSPDTVRTLGLRNTDMEVISVTFNAAFSPIVQSSTSAAQR
eukprot:6526031-Pyramimonas_sp.AAC.1